MAKVRVYELAKELGVESKTLLNHLKEQGEFVRSASSTIEPPVVRKIRETFPAELAAAGGPAADVKGSAARPAPKKSTAKPGAPAAPVAAAPVAAAPAAPAAPAAAAPAAAVAAPAAPVVPSVAAPAAARAGVPRAPSRPVADAPKAPAPKAPAPVAPAAREGGADTGRPAPRPGAPRPGNNPFAPSQGMPRRWPRGPRAPRRARAPPRGPRRPAGCSSGQQPLCSQPGNASPAGWSPGSRQCRGAPSRRSASEPGHDA